MTSTMGPTLLSCLLLVSLTTGCGAAWRDSWAHLYGDPAYMANGRYEPLEPMTRLTTQTDAELRAAGYVDIGTYAYESQAIPEDQWVSALGMRGRAAGAHLAKIVGVQQISVPVLEGERCVDYETATEIFGTGPTRTLRTTTRCVGMKMAAKQLELYRMSATFWRLDPDEARRRAAIPEEWPVETRGFVYRPHTETLSEVDLLCRGGRVRACFALANHLAVNPFDLRRVEFPSAQHYHEFGRLLVSTRCIAGDTIPYCRYAAERARARENANDASDYTARACAAGDPQVTCEAPSH